MGLCVLLVDDSATVRSLVKVCLMGNGFEYLEAEGAEHALRILGSRIPDVVIADINMPGMNGLAFLSRIRRDPRREVSALPTILLTSNKAKEIRAQAKELGANEFVMKPVTSSDLYEALSRVVPGVFKPPSSRSR